MASAPFISPRWQPDLARVLGRSPRLASGMFPAAVSAFVTFAIPIRRLTVSGNLSTRTASEFHHVPPVPMDQLIAGYHRFRAGTWRNEHVRFEELSDRGQQPRALIIACSDSRTDPQMVFDAVPGELFVIRNIANLVPPYGPDDQPHGVSSAIEYAVRVLRVRDIVVMGHAMCGGIKALLDGTPPELSDFVGPWVRIAEPARQRAMAVAPEHRHDF